MAVAQSSQPLAFDQQDLLRQITPLVRDCIRQTASFQVEINLKVLLERDRHDVQIWEDRAHKHIYQATAKRMATERMVPGLNDVKVGGRINQAVQEFKSEIEQGWSLLDQFNRNCILLNFKFKDCRLVGVSWETNRKISQGGV